MRGNLSHPDNLNKHTLNQLLHFVSEMKEVAAGLTDMCAALNTE